VNPELELLRPALEMAMIVARQDDPPRSLQPFLRFTKLPPLALSAAQAALEDDEFRQRVTERCDEEEVGRAGWLFLTRPDGWADEFAALVEDRRERDDADAEHTARRELERAREAIVELERELADERRDRAHARAGLAERDSELEVLTKRIADAETAVALAAEERARAVRELKEMERRLAQRTEELRAARQPDADVVAAHDPGFVEDANRLAELRAEWQQLAPLLERLDDLLSEHDEPAPEPATGRAANAQRRAVRLEGGLVDGTPEAVRWLLGRPGAVALVDGYNVTMTAWPELSAAEQRGALERAAERLQVLTGARLVLVFDGDSAGGTAVRSAVGSAVRVRFTDASTEADDRILEMIDECPSGPVVVVSSDRRVRDGARARGANVVGAPEFVQLLR